MYVLLGLPMNSAERTPIFTRTAHGFAASGSQARVLLRGGRRGAGAAAPSAATTPATGRRTLVRRRLHGGGLGGGVGRGGCVGGATSGTGPGALAGSPGSAGDDLALGRCVGTGRARPAARAAR